MACAIGSSKMAIMERLLVAGNFSQNVTGPFDRQKLVSQCTYIVLRDADEANLLDVTDMHVFGEKPMEEPMYLVCCNTCRKPIRASQYKTHAELCRSLITPELLLELDSGAGKKKPLRKARNKAVTDGSQSLYTGVQDRPEIVHASYHAASDSNVAEQEEKMIGQSLYIGVQDRPEIVHAPYHAASDSNVAEQEEIMPPFLSDSKDGQRCANYASTRSNWATHLETCKPAAAGFPPSNQTNLTTADMQPTSDGIGTVQDVSMTFNRQTQSAYPVAPLATKMYNYQSDDYLRTAFGQMYHGTFDEDSISYEPNYNAFDGHVIEPNYNPFNGHVIEPNYNAFDGHVIEPNYNAFDGHVITSQCTSSKIISDEQMGSPSVEVRGEAETAESCIFSHSAQGLPKGSHVTSEEVGGCVPFCTEKPCPA